MSNHGTPTNAFTPDTAGQAAHRGWDLTEDRAERTEPAHAARMESAAIAAADNPVKRGRAVRIVRAALKSGALTLGDLQGEIVQQSDREVSA